MSLQSSKITATVCAIALLAVSTLHTAAQNPYNWNTGLNRHQRMANVIASNMAREAGWRAMLGRRNARSGASRTSGTSRSTSRRTPATNSTKQPTNNRTAGTQGSHGTTATAAAAMGSTVFRPVAAMLIPKQLATEAAQAPADRRDMEAFFAQCLNNYETNMRQQGQPVKDVARAVSYFIGVSYNIYQGGNALTATQGAALRAEIREALAQDEGFLRLSNREKQQMYETMAVTAEYIAISSDVAAQQGNTQLAELARDMAKDNLESLLGVPAAQIRITDNGLEY